MLTFGFLKQAHLGCESGSSIAAGCCLETAYCWPLRAPLGKCSRVQSRTRMLTLRWSGLLGAVMPSLAQPSLLRSNFCPTGDNWQSACSKATLPLSSPRLSRAKVAATSCHLN